MSDAATVAVARPSAVACDGVTESAICNVLAVGMKVIGVVMNALPLAPSLSERVSPCGVGEVICATKMPPALVVPLVVVPLRPSATNVLLVPLAESVTL